MIVKMAHDYHNVAIIIYEPTSTALLSIITTWRKSLTMMNLYGDSLEETQA